MIYRGERRAAAKTLYRDGKARNFPAFWQIQNDDRSNVRFTQDQKRRQARIGASNANGA